MTERPAPTGAELRRWYWTLTELTALARSLEVRTGGGKLALVDRLAAALDGAEPASPPPRPRAWAQLVAPLHGGSVLPPGQRCSQVLRTYLTERIGPAFRFDAHVRAFVADGAGCTLGELVEHWHATRSAPPAEIGAQFELNRFLREQRAAHPGESRADALAAWREHRARPRPA